jgi:hypothetical protein
MQAEKVFCSQYQGDIVRKSECGVMTYYGTSFLLISEANSSCT